MGASGLPKMDVVGSADPYFVAKLDDEISFVFVVSSLPYILAHTHSWHYYIAPPSSKTQSIHHGTKSGRLKMYR